jgi:3D (Asp-Asp-Asp) domain-containing protein
MRTVAVDPTLIPRRTVLFIAETVGLPLPGGGVHDGYWYASDTGGAVKGRRIDLFTGSNHGSMAPAFKFNLQKLSVSKAGRFDGCPPPLTTAQKDDGDDVKAAASN